MEIQCLVGLYFGNQFNVVCEDFVQILYKLQYSKILYFSTICAVGILVVHKHTYTLEIMFLCILL